MKWNSVLVTMVSVGMMAATAVKAQDNAAPEAATETQGQTAKSAAPDYGAVLDEPATVDADGVPVAKPNPMSDFLRRAQDLGGTQVEMPLVDDFRTDGTGTDGATK